MRSNNYYVQMTVTITPMVKALLIANTVIWFLAVIVAQGFIFKNNIVFDVFGLSAGGVLESFKLWQPITYIFLHSTGIWHILFNCLIIWFIGSELEKIWGQKEFLKYYLTCGIGAGILYVVIINLAVNLFSLNPGFMKVPTIGASGAVFGLLVAYGVIFGERIIFFMMLFPMKAKYFILLLGIVEVFTLITSGFGGAVNNTAHLGGFIVGFLYIYLSRHINNKRQKRWLKKPEQRLKLIVDNEIKKEDKPTFH